jgi:spore maturation protein CgeB
MKIKKIIIASDFSKPWNFCCFVRSGLEQNGIEVSVFDSRLTERPFISLMSLIDTFRPDVMLHMKDRSIDIEWLREVSKRGVITVQWYPDIALPGWLVPYIENTDIFFTMAEGMVDEFKRHNRNVFWLSQAFEPSSFRVTEITSEDRERFSADVTFVGTLGSKGYYIKRREYLQRVVEEDVRFRWWGPRLPRKFSTLPLIFGKLGKAYGGRFIWGEEYAKVAKFSRIFLAFDAEPGIRKSMSARMYTAVGCGAFYMCLHVEGIEDVMEPGREILTFNSTEEMIDLMKYYLGNDGARTRIARAGRKRILRDHTYKIRTEQMMRMIEDVL